MTITRTITSAVLLSAVVLALAACGGDDDDEEGDNSAATATQEQQQPADGADATEEPEATAASEPTGQPDNNGDGSGDGSVGASEACSVLTKADVEDAFGVTMLEPEFIELPDVPIPGGGNASVGSCSFVSDVATDSLSLTLYSADVDGVQALFDLACDGKESVDAGDEACWFSEAHTQIQMRAGSNFVDIFVTTVDGDSTEITTAIAAKVAASLN